MVEISIWMVESKNWQFYSDFLWIVIWILLTSQAHALSAWPWIWGKMLKPVAPLGGEGSGDGDAEVGQRWEGLGRLCLSLVLTSSTSCLESHEQVQLFHHISAFEMPQSLCFPLLPSTDLSSILFQQGERKLTDHVIVIHTWSPSVSAGAGGAGGESCSKIYYMEVEEKGLQNIHVCWEYVPKRAGDSRWVMVKQQNRWKGEGILGPWVSFLVLKEEFPWQWEAVNW